MHGNSGSLRLVECYIPILGTEVGSGVREKALQMKMMQ